MAHHWKHRLDIQTIWQGELNAQQIGKEIARKIRVMLPKKTDWESDQYDDEITEIAERFDNVTGFDNVSPIQEFNDIMYDLYEWADTNECWVATFF